MNESLVFCEHCYLNLNAEPLTDRGWPEHDLFWFLGGTLPGFALEAVAGIVATACFGWTRHCNLRMLRTKDVSKSDIRMAVARIDGPRGVLGRSQLPPARPVMQEYDNAEDWQNEIDPLTVIEHELGHALGLQHDPRPGALMSAFYDPAIREPTPRDVARIRALYGAPVTPPSPEPPRPIPPDVGSVLLQIFNADQSEGTWKRIIV